MCLNVRLLNTDPSTSGQCDSRWTWVSTLVLLAVSSEQRPTVAKMKAAPGIVTFGYPARTGKCRVSLMSRREFQALLSDGLMDQSTREGLRNVKSTSSEANVNDSLAEELDEVSMLKEEIQLRKSKT